MPIIIEKKHKNPAIPFGDLNRGDAFIYNNEIHIKVSMGSEEDEYFTAINLKEGTENYFDVNDLIVPVKEAVFTYSL